MKFKCAYSKRADIANFKNKRHDAIANKKLSDTPYLDVVDDKNAS